MHTLGVILISLAIIFALIGAAFAAVYLLLEWAELVIRRILVLPYA